MAKKRGQNEGSIYKRKDGSWCAQVTLDGRRLSKYGKTRKECSEWLRDTLAQIDRGLSIAGAQASVDQYLTEWIKSSKSKLHPNTWMDYSQIIRDHLIPKLGKIKLKDLRPDQIQSLYNSKIEGGKSLATVRVIHAVLHSALDLTPKYVPVIMIVQPTGFG